jgi:hypothetical protein
MATPVLRVGNGPGGNYEKKLMQFLEQHPEILASGGLHNIAVRHDSWCGIHKGRACNCEVEVELMR